MDTATARYRLRYFEPTYGMREHVVTGAELAKDRVWLDAGGYAYTATLLARI